MKMEEFIQLAGEPLKTVLNEHGPETLVKTLNIITVMADAVRDKYGECDEIMYAIDIMHEALTSVRKKIKND